MKYLQDLSEILAQQVLQAVKANPDAVKNEELKEFYSVLFKRFTVYDVIDLHPNVCMLQEELLSRIEGKASFLID